MDKSLEEIIRGNKGSNRNTGGRRRNNNPRDGVHKSTPPPPRNTSRNLDRDEWVHDKYAGEDDEDGTRSYRNQRDRRRRSPEAAPADSGYKVKIENLHYELTEDDIRNLCEKVGRVRSVQLIYDRQDRSRGIAFTTYYNLSDAATALNQFHGQQALGQTIYLSMVPTTGPRGLAAAEKPRSLADRIQPPRRDRNNRSLSPEVRHSDVSRPVKSGIDRYVPGGGHDDEDMEDRRRPAPRGPRGGRGGGRDGGSRPGERRERNGGREERGGRGGSHKPKKTHEEMDAELDEFLNRGTGTVQGNGAAAPAASTDDVDMIE